MICKRFQMCPEDLAYKDSASECEFIKLLTYNFGETFFEILQI